MSTSTVFVYTLNGGKGKWSRYSFPFSIEAFAQLGNVLYVRHGDVVSRVVEEAVNDEVDGVGVPFPGIVQSQWLDCGAAGVTKMLDSLDYIGTGQGPSVSIGYDQRNAAAFTTPYAIDPDTMPGTSVPIPVAAPTFSVRLDYNGGEKWSLQAVNLYTDTLAGEP